MTERDDLVEAVAVRTAHADAWEELGRAALAVGGGLARFPGIRLMASGLPYPQWNNGDVSDAAAVDIERVARWYHEREVPWGVRVPVGAAWPHGRKLFEKRLMGMNTDACGAGPLVDGLQIRPATPIDLDVVAEIDAAAFEEPVAVERLWMALVLGAASTVVAIAELHGEPVATGYTVASEGDAGPALYLAGVAVKRNSRRRGVGGAVSAWLLHRAAQSGPRLAHLHPDTDEAARVYARLGFVETPGFDVYIDNAP